MRSKRAIPQMKASASPYRALAEGFVLMLNPLIFRHRTWLALAVSSLIRLGLSVAEGLENGTACRSFSILTFGDAKWQPGPRY